MSKSKFVPSKAECRKLRILLKQALKSVSDEMGCDFNLDEARLTYTDQEIRFKLIASKPVSFVVREVSNLSELDDDTDAQTTAQSPEQTLWNDHCGRFGMEKSLFGRTTAVGGTACTIVGIRPRAKKNCVKLLGIRGGSWICSAEQAQRGLQ